MESKFSEVRIDQFDDERNIAFIDAWKTSDDMEEGMVLGEINLNSNKVILRDDVDEDVLSDPLVKEKYEEFCNEINPIY